MDDSDTVPAKGAHKSNQSANLSLGVVRSSSAQEMPAAARTKNQVDAELVDKQLHAHCTADGTHGYSTVSESFAEVADMDTMGVSRPCGAAEFFTQHTTSVCNGG